MDVPSSIPTGDEKIFLLFSLDLFGEDQRSCDERWRLQILAGNIFFLRVLYQKMEVPFLKFLRCIQRVWWREEKRSCDGLGGEGAQRHFYSSKTGARSQNPLVIIYRLRALCLFRRVVFIAEQYCNSWIFLQLRYSRHIYNFASYASFPPSTSISSPSPLLFLLMKLKRRLRAAHGRKALTKPLNSLLYV